jgi:hypothetical protein
MRAIHGVLGSILLSVAAVATGAEAQSRRAQTTQPRVVEGERRVVASAASSPRGTSAERASRSGAERPRPSALPCLGPTVELRRANGGFSWSGALVDCRGRVRPEALAAIAAIASPQSGAHSFGPDLSALAAEIRRVAPVAGWTLAEPPVVARDARRAGQARRGARVTAVVESCPRGQEPVSASEARSETALRSRVAAGARQVRGEARRPALRCRAIEVQRDPHTRDVVLEIDRRVRVVHPRLVEMLAQVSARWPGRAIEVVSGYRPSSDPHAGSRHAHARAMDFRVAGVAREALRDFCRTLPLAGVGYYPHSVFVHLDVRDRGEGSARWTDYSDPGERPRYGHWPPSTDDVVREVQHITRRVDALLEAAARGEQ